jgi:hypothetical protein
VENQAASGGGYQWRAGAGGRQLKGSVAGRDLFRASHRWIVAAVSIFCLHVVPAIPHDFVFDKKKINEEMCNLP